MEADGTIAANLNFLGFTEASIVQTLKMWKFPLPPNVEKLSSFTSQKHLTCLFLHA